MDGIEFSSPGRAGLADSDHVTQGGVAVGRRCTPLGFDGAVAPLIASLDRRRGVLLSSGTEYPGRYTRWDIGFADPPLGLTARGRQVTVTALNARGRVLLRPLERRLGGLDAVAALDAGLDSLVVAVRPPARRFAE
jgi:anthranilate synthase